MSFNSLKVLVCDDSILIRKKLKDFLEECGCSVLEALDGQKAVDIYKEEKPDLVFMDIVMPVKSGIQATEEIIEFDKNAKVVIASSSGTKTHLKQALEAGAYEFVQKPLDEAQIKDILTNYNKEV
ncbi:MAG TPA: response regulator [Pseudobacteroides sp.]|nr:response regulator [Pseudobacteroides sp.]